MSALLNAKLSLHVVSTSHLSFLDCNKAQSVKQHTQFASNFKTLLPGATSIDARKGMILMPLEFSQHSLDHMNKSSFRISQVEKTTKSLQSSDCDNCLMVTGSNDHKALLVNRGQFIELKPHSAEIWENMSPQQKINYNCRTLGFLPVESRDFLTEKLQEYKNALTSLFSGSTIKKVFHSSILERIYPGQSNLDLYFAILNSYLKKMLNECNSKNPIFNKNGEKIKWVYINVTEQYYGALDPSTLFRPGEQKTGVMTHRHDEAMKDMVKKYHAFIVKNLNKN